MTKFIRLLNKNMVLNVSKIVNIDIYKESYRVFMSQNNVRGVIIGPIGVFQSDIYNINVDKNIHAIDYQILTKWIQCNSSSYGYTTPEDEHK